MHLVPSCQKCNRLDKSAKPLKSPECTKRQSLPELRLLTILQSGSQERFDNFLNIMKNLGLHLSTLLVHRQVFEAATSIIFEDHQGAVEALSAFMHASDHLDIEILRIKLNGLTSPALLGSICSSLENNTVDGELAEPGFLLDKDHMLKLLKISWRDWISLKNFWGLSGMFGSHTEKLYSKSEISQIAHIIHFYPEALHLSKANKAEKLRQEFFSYTDISKILNLTESTVRYLG